MKHDLDQLKDVKLHPTSAKTEDKKLKTDAEIDEENLEDYGDIRIADEVIRIVASLAAQEVPGVVSMSGGLTDGINRFLGKENASKGVRLKFEGRTVNASMYLNVEGVATRETKELEQEATSEDAMAYILRAQAHRAEATEVNSFEQQLAGLRDFKASEDESSSVKAIKRKYENEDKNVAPKGRFDLPPEEEMDEKQKRFFEED